MATAVLANLGYDQARLEKLRQDEVQLTQLLNDYERKVLIEVQVKTSALQMIKLHNSRKARHEAEAMVAKANKEIELLTPELVRCLKPYRDVVAEIHRVELELLKEELTRYKGEAPQSATSSYLQRRSSQLTDAQRNTFELYKPKRRSTPYGPSFEQNHQPRTSVQYDPQQQQCQSPVGDERSFKSGASKSSFPESTSPTSGTSTDTIAASANGIVSSTNSFSTGIAVEAPSPSSVALTVVGQERGMQNPLRSQPQQQQQLPPRFESRSDGTVTNLEEAQVQIRTLQAANTELRNVQQVQMTAIEQWQQYCNRIAASLQTVGQERAALQKKVEELEAVFAEQNQAKQVENGSSAVERQPLEAQALVRPVGADVNASTIVQSSNQPDAIHARGPMAATAAEPHYSTSSSPSLSATSSKDNLESEISALTAQLTSLRTAHTEQDRVCRTQAAAIEQWVDYSGKLEKELEGLKREKGEVVGRVQELETMVEKLRTRDNRNDVGEVAKGQKPRKEKEGMSREDTDVPPPVPPKQDEAAVLLKGQLAEAMAELERIAREKVDISTRLTESERVRTQLEQEVQAHHHHHHHHHQHKPQQQSSLPNDAETQTQQSDPFTIESLKTRIIELENDVEQKNRECQDLRRCLDEAVESARANDAAQQREQHRVSEVEQQWKQKVTSLETELVAKAEELQILKKAYEEASTRAGELQAKLTGLESQLETATRSRSVLEHELSEFRTREEDGLEIQEEHAKAVEHQQQMQQQILTLRAENESLRQDVLAEAERSRTSHQEQLDRTAQLELQWTQRVSEVEKMKATEMESWARELETMKLELQRAVEEARTKDMKIGSDVEVIDVLKDRVMALETSLSETTKELDNLLTRGVQDADAVKLRLEELSRHLVEKEAEITRLVHERDGHSVRMQELQQRLHEAIAAKESAEQAKDIQSREMEERVSGLEQQWTQKVTHLESELASKMEELGRLKDAHNEQSSQFAELRAKVVESESQLVELRTLHLAHVEQSKLLAESQAKLVEVESQLSECKEQVDAARKQSALLEEDGIKVREEHANVLERLELQVSALKAEKETLRRDLEAEAGRTGTLKLQLEHIQGQLQQQQSSHPPSAKSANPSEGDVAMEQQLQALMSKNITLIQDLADKDAELRDLTIRLRQAEDDADRAQSSAQVLRAKVKELEEGKGGSGWW
ncbi:hypothetical protein HK102_002486 [Quaeritorhiza haematococci]|nr:hypothetical protein HK102_002486 [Quaeritorhiza haematococci]